MHEQAIAQNFDAVPLHAQRHFLAVVEGEATTRERELAWFQRRPDDPDLLRFSAEVAATSGRLGEARTLYDHWIEITRRMDPSGAVGEIFATRGRIEAGLGNLEQARSDATAARGGGVTSLGMSWIGVLSAWIGQTRDAEAVAEELTRAHPSDTS